MKRIKFQLSRKVKERVAYRATHKTPADEETCGVYFSDDIKRELIKNRENSTCHYSGLPSLETYK